LDEQDRQEAEVVIVVGTFEVDPTEREQFLANRHDRMRQSRAEAGCLAYAFSADPIDPSRVLLFERWASQEDLDAHLAAPPAGPEPSGTQVEPRASSIVIYDVTGERPLGG
jgi:quinol monooxygenase YgiN